MSHEEPSTPGRPVLNGEPTLRIDRSIPCGGCQYDLKGLSTHGRCPECGMSILKTVDRFRPKLDKGSLLGRFCYGMSLNGNAWLVSGFLSTLGCVLVPFGLAQVVTLFLAFATAGRILAVGGPIYMNPTAIPGGLPDRFLRTLFLVICGLEILVALLVTFGIPRMEVAFLLLILLTALEGVGWMEFIKYCGRQTECTYTTFAVVSTQCAWTLVLLSAGFIVMLHLADSLGTVGNNVQGLQGVSILVLLCGAIMWVLAVFSTGIITRALSDALARMDYEKTDPLEALINNPLMQSPGGRAPEDVEDAPLPLADSSGTNIEITERDALSAPPEPPKERRFQSDGEDVF